MLFQDIFFLSGRLEKKDAPKAVLFREPDGVRKFPAWHDSPDKSEGFGVIPDSEEYLFCGFFPEKGAFQGKKHRNCEKNE